MALKKRRAAKPDFSRVEKKDETPVAAAKPTPLATNTNGAKPERKPFWKRLFSR